MASRRLSISNLFIQPQKLKTNLFAYSVIFVYIGFIMSCSKCHIRNANPGHGWCQMCYTASRQPGFAVGSQRMCDNCHIRPANPNYSWCQACYDVSIRIIGQTGQPRCQICNNAAWQGISPGCNRSHAAEAIRRGFTGPRQ